MGAEAGVASCARSVTHLRDALPRVLVGSLAPAADAAKYAAALRYRTLMAITGKAAEDILERIFQPTTKPSAMDQAEETLRHPKRLVYVAMSNKAFYWRAHIQKFVLDSGMVPVSPFMLFDYYLMHTVSKEIVREAMNNLLARCDEVWVFGRLSLGVKVQVGIAKRMNKPVRYFDISDLPVAIMPISGETAEEELRD